MLQLYYLLYIPFTISFNAVMVYYSSKNAQHLSRKKYKKWLNIHYFYIDLKQHFFDSELLTSDFSFLVGSNF